jgi:pilus assembly protein CpaD
MAQINWIQTAGRTMAVLAAAAMLGGCLNTTTNWTGAEPEKRSTVEMVRLTHDVAVTDAGVLSPESAGQLDAFMESINLGYGDRLIVDAGGRTAAGQAVSRHLTKQGFNISPLSTPLGAERSGGVVRVAVERYVVTLPPCPDWRQPSWPNRNNVPTSNMGCANATALGMMVANPRDLLEGQEFSGPDGGVSADAITRYQQDKVKWEQKGGSAPGAGGSTTSSSK